METLYRKVLLKAEKSEQSEGHVKDIVAKMECKVDEAEKNLMVKEKEVVQLEKVV